MDWVRTTIKRISAFTAFSWHSVPFEGRHRRNKVITHTHTLTQLQLMTCGWLLCSPYDPQLPLLPDNSRDSKASVSPKGKQRDLCGLFTHRDLTNTLLKVIMIQYGLICFILMFVKGTTWHLFKIQLNITQYCALNHLYSL